MITAAAPLVAASEKKRLANRSNALKSTGPTSDAGKAKSAQNARKFGIFCKDLLVPGEDQQDLDALKRDMLRSLNPRNEVELQLVEQIVADEWRIKRIRSAERTAYERLHAEDCRRVRKVNEQRRAELLAELGAYQKKFATEIRESRVPENVARIMAEVNMHLAQLDAVTLPEPDPGMALERLMQSSPDLERLWKHEQRLRNSVHRCMKELRQIRKEGVDELSELTSGMLDEEQQVEEANVKNEATADASESVETSCDADARDVDASYVTHKAESKVESPPEPAPKAGPSRRSAA